MFLFSDSNFEMSEEAPELSVENENDKDGEDKTLTKVEGDMGDLKLEGDVNKNEEAPADEIGILESALTTSKQLLTLQT